MDEQARSAVALLRRRPVSLGLEFRRIWVGNAASNLADGVTFVTMALLAAALTQDPLAVAGLSIAHTVPRIFTVLGVGVLVDRADRRRLLYLANFSRAAIFALLTLLVAVGAAPLMVLYVVYAALGVIETVSDTSAFAVLPQAVAAPDLDRANSQIAGTQVVIDEFVGPPLGGLLVGLAACAATGLTAVAFLVAGLSYLALRGTYTRPVPDLSAADPSAPHPSTPAPSVLADITEGTTWALRHPVVRTLVVISALASVGYMIPFSYLVLYADAVLGLDTTGYGLLLSFSALGGLAGSWLAGRLRRWFGYGWSIVGALAVGAASFIVIATTTNVVVVALALAAYIAHAVVWNVLAASVRQRAVPAALMGRVAAVSRLLSLLGLALGALLGGTLAGLLGFRVPFLVAAGLFLVAGAVCLLAMAHVRTWEASLVRAAADQCLVIP